MLWLLLKFGMQPALAGKIAKPLLIVLAIAATIGAIALAIDKIGDDAVDGFKAEQRADNAERQLAREQQATSADTSQAKADQAKADQLQGEIDNAIATRPDEARRPAGPATNAALDQLRRRATDKRGE